jgi:hypothetical protein
MLSNLCSIYYFFCLCLNTQDFYVLNLSWFRSLRSCFWICANSLVWFCFCWHWRWAVLITVSVYILWPLETDKCKENMLSLCRIELNAQPSFFGFFFYFSFEILNILFFFPLILSFRILNYNQQGSHWCY